MKKGTLLVITFISIQAFCFASKKTEKNNNGGKSIYHARLQDSDAVYFTPENFKIKADGKTDVSDELQAAITKVKTEHNFGVLFIPEGKYLISKTIFIPTAVRLIGYGKNRPQIILAKNSPGFQTADENDKGHARYMFWFVSNLSKPGDEVHDAGASTFYSSISNVNLKIEDGNPYAVAMRTHFAQHSFIAHVDINIGKGLAGMFDVGNEMEDVRFFGGQYGIYTTKPSPGWQFMMVDTYFEGQREAAIRTQEAGLTIVRMNVKHVPTVISINPNYHEKLFMEDCRFDGVSGPAIIISNEDNAFNQINLRNVICRNVPVLASYRRSSKTTPGAANIYRVKNFTYGLQMDGLDTDPQYKTINEQEPFAALPETVKKDIPDFPAIETWANLKALGAKGDGVTDDTQTIQAAIDKYETIYVPQGWYRVSQTIKLKPDTKLIGLNPIATQFLIADNTPAFGGFGGPVALLESSKGGNNILSGIGICTNADNPRAVACKWMAGVGSYMNDVKFVGGHGGMQRVGTPKSTAGSGAYNRVQNGMDPSWDTQYWSLWVTDGGGGTFKDIWSANTYATAGTYISNTQTPGRIYAMSIEHHVRNEVRFNNVANWKVYAMQLEEESRESTECQPMELENSNNMVFANLYMFRVIRVNKPAPYAIRKWGGKNIELLNVHNYSQIKYTSTLPLYDINTATEVRPWEFARLYIDDKANAAEQQTGTINKLATGFEFASAVCADSKGNIYFSEQRMKRIYKWSATDRQISLLADYPWEPLSLACDKNDNLLVVFKYVPKPGYLVNGKPEKFDNPADAAGTSFSGWGNSGFASWAYSITPNSPDETIQKLKTIPMGQVNPVYKALYPAHRWRDYHDFNAVTVNKPTECFVAPDGVTIIPVVYDLARSTALAAAYPGKPLYSSDEYDKRTVSTTVNKDGYLSDLKYFAERGEFASATDDKGNVYIADGQIYVYDSAGKQINVIKVPERPTGLAFGGVDNNTIYITSHNSLFSVKVK
ncbi:SMP-30/Gluconolaconase/LRE-like region-containing protein [Mucilaginibacter gossypiicola]|uniref:SMP-30/Gluconolaconase/LRE-like region-containing protein n=1 Tax=Mucilaginibacter gossypiicola TaxID=551995 RepID=A0A1H8UG32_9SPHI|nr:glycosyl hydrolase family 28-related protein [Mucilaginibacter gossypiicola]SEP02131.1 SMP-30/Gluconolaconase/LRE-like region-containing protein [Mucilaginibacter gossypiicola]